MAESQQGGFFDRTVEDPELAAAIDLSMETGYHARQHARAKRKISKRLERYALQPGERLRVDRFVVEGVLRTGGGFEIPEWEKTCPGLITELGEA
jgi:hypothetical protein